MRSVERIFLPLLLGVLLASPAWGALQAVGPVSAANGFPAWYQDTNGLQLELCLDQNGMCLTAEPNPAQPIAFPDNFGDEAFWWAGESDIPDGGNGISGLLTLAMEGAFLGGAPAVGDQMSFTRVRIRADVPTPGTYTVTHPYGTETFDVQSVGAGSEINITRDIGCTAAPCDFDLALAGDVGPFLIPASGELVTVGANIYLADPLTPIAVTGSPFDTNFFRIQGPGGVAQSDLFTIMGKVANCGAGNVSPVTQGDLGATGLGLPLTLPIVGNDTDNTAINPASIVITVPPANGTAAARPNGSVTYTSVAGFTGVDSFTYTVQDFCALTSAPATVQVIVEGMTAARAELRPRFGKWHVAGTSTLSSLSLSGTDLLAGIEGAQANPPVTSAAGGIARVNLPAGLPASFDYLLEVETLPVTPITQAHIHVGGTGMNGSPIFFLCTDLGNAPPGVVVPPCTTAGGRLTVSGTLDAAALVPRPAEGINTYADALNAIRGGNAYVNVHTTANPGGEIRGQIGRNVVILRNGSANGPVIGKTEVKDGAWSFDGKSRVSPGAGPRSVHVESSTGASATLPLRLR